jgi:hypothetical protein
VNGLTVLLAKELLGTNILRLDENRHGRRKCAVYGKGAETAVYLATLTDGGAQGQFFAQMRSFGGPIQLQW